MSDAPEPPVRSHYSPAARVSTFFDEMRIVARSLVRAPGFTATVVLSVGLGIGATAAMFSAVHALLIEPLPYADPERLVRIHRDHPAGRWPLSVVDFEAIRDQQTHFTRVAAFRDTSLTLTLDGVAERIRVTQVTPGYFETLGVATLHGRQFVDADGVPGTERTALLNHGFWRTRFGGDPAAVGRSITLNGVPFTVVGILPPGAGPLQEDRDAFAVLQLQPPQRRGPFFLQVLGRLAPGADVDSARTELAAINERLFPIWRDSYPDETVSFNAESLREFVVGDAGPPLLVLLGAVGLVWLIASTNAANLLVARGSRRRRDLAVRAALGASRGRLLRQLLTEGALLGLGGTAFGVGLAAVAVQGLSGLGPELLPRASEVELNAPVWAFMTAVAVASLAIFALLPALQVLGRAGGGGQGLPSGARWASEDRAAQRVRRLLVPSQFAVAVPLLVATGLLLTSFAELRRVDPGFEVQGLLTVNLPLAGATYPDADAVGRFWREVTERVGALPGVRAVGMGEGRPPGEYPYSNNFSLVDRPTPPDQADPTCPWMSADAGYFRALGLPLHRGRLFDERDRDGSPLVVVVDRTWAERFYPGEDPEGRQLTAGGCNRPDCPKLTVIGVVGDVKYEGLSEPGQGVVYWSQSQVPSWFGYLYVRTEGEPYDLLPSIRAVVADVDASVPLSRIASGTELVQEDLASPRGFLNIVGGFAVVALILAMIGIYGVMSYFVELHAREIAVRMAVGGRPVSVGWLILGRGLRLAGAGLVVGVAGAFALSRYLTSMLFEVSPTDLRTFAAVVAALSGAAFVACFLPALRAAHTDPATVLQAE